MTQRDAEVVQGSDEWHALRAGRFTASKFADLMARLKSGKPSQSRENVIWDVVVERMTGKKMTSFQSPWMARGLLLEEGGRAAYELERLVSVDQVGIVVHPELPYVSCSPDGLIGCDGLIEIKCLTAANHGKALIHNHHARDYAWQVQGQMWITGRDWCDVVAYHPEFPADLQLAICRVERDEEAIAELEAACIEANEEVEEAVRLLKARAA